MEDRYLLKGKEKDSGKWLEWNALAGIPHNVTILTNTICQCTGLKDKNDKLIWENDIVNCTDAECYGYISWNESEVGFYFNVLLEGGGFDDEHIYNYQDCMEVVGNIFDNKDLLESGEK